ncbi:MAG: dockerin type I repeat-containing protein [Oscillospiraceae bacterium]|nr:dockerin type I repeat-containing protein [Oscillospiraceae bacterium]
MPENDTIPSLDNITIEKAGWLYFCPWYDEESTPKFLSGKEYQDAEEVEKIYKSDYCITLSELPKDWKGYEASAAPTDPGKDKDHGKDKDPDKNTDPTAEPSPTKDVKTAVLGDVNADGNIDVTDLTELSLALLGDRKLTEDQKKLADIDGDGELSLADLARLRQYLSKKIDKLG